MMNTWTNKDIQQESKKPKKLAHRPRSGNPSPSKLQNELDKFTNGKVLNAHNSRQNPAFMPRQQYALNNSDAGILRSYSNKPQPFPQSNSFGGGHPQPHQRNIKKGIMNSHKTNMQNDMYRIYGVNKSDLGHAGAPTPKTSSGKREHSNPKNPFAARINNQMMPTRVGQHTSHGNRSVSPNRFPAPDGSNTKDTFGGTQRPNMVEILKFQARTNLKNLEKDMSAVMGRHKKMIKKKKINKTGMNLYGFRKPSPTHKRVKSNMISKAESWYGSNYNPTGRVEGVKGFGYGLLTSFNRGKEGRVEPIKPFTRNQSRKKYRDHTSDSHISDSYLKSFDGKRIKKKTLNKQRKIN